MPPLLVVAVAAVEMVEVVEVVEVVEGVEGVEVKVKKKTARMLERALSCKVCADAAAAAAEL